MLEGKDAKSTRQRWRRGVADAVVAFSTVAEVVLWEEFGVEQFGSL